jgi:signal transduction histidine kinase
VRDTGLGPALHDLARRFRQRTGTEVTLLIDPQAPDRADQRAETMFRIVEEALRNVERHAQAAGVQISLARSPDASGLPAGEATEVGGIAVVEAGAATRAATQVRIEVVDDGVGFDPDDPHPGHFGLRGMQEQAALIAAQLRIVSRPGQGTRVQLDFVA